MQSYICMDLLNFEIHVIQLKKHFNSVLKHFNCQLNAHTILADMYCRKGFKAGISYEFVLTESYLQLKITSFEGCILYISKKCVFIYDEQLILL